MSSRAVAAGWVLAILVGLLVLNVAYSRDRDCRTSTIVNRGVDQAVGRDSDDDRNLDQRIADCLDDEASAKDLRRALMVLLSIASVSALIVFLVLWKGPSSGRGTRRGGPADGTRPGDPP